MEFRDNIIFSVVAHASVVATILAFAGRSATLARLPDRYFAVTLLEHSDETKFERGDVLKRNVVDQPGKSDMKSRRAFSLHDNTLMLPDAVERLQDAGNDAMNEERILEENLYRDSNNGQSLDRVPDQRASLQGKPAAPESGAGDNYSPASSTGVQGIMSGSGMELRMTGSVPSGGDGSIDQIKAAIEKAKLYPLFARERGQKGTVIVEFSINGAGGPENIRVAKSSGYALLDSAARDTVIRAAPFPLVKGIIEAPIRFTIETKK